MQEKETPERNVFVIEAEIDERHENLREAILIISANQNLSDEEKNAEIVEATRATAVRVRQLGAEVAALSKK